MPQIRPFTNFDPPAVTEVWQHCARQPGLTSPVSVDSFERLVFSKLYFPQSRLLLAVEGDKPLGFAHAAFGPNGSRDWISTETGVTCMLLVCPECPRRELVARQLLDHCEHFLAGCGALAIQGGEAPPLVPFYTGLYGGSMPPGILADDRFTLEAFEGAGYQLAGRTLICRRSLEGFRPPVDRRLMQIRRTMRMTTLVDPPPRDWWEAMEIGEFDLTRFELAERNNPRPVASLLVRDMGPPSPDLPGPAAGVLDLVVDSEYRRQGLATFLIAEAIKQLVQHGVSSVEVHVSADDPAAASLCRKLGFVAAAEAVRFRKTLTSS
ncbi:MAG: GNAT family N-acetyltransferase [Thermoguttaceae bacterium]